MAYYALYITDTGDLSHLQNGDKVPLRPERLDPSLSYLEITQEQYDGIQIGELVWDPATHTTSVDPDWVHPDILLAEYEARALNLNQAIPTLREWAADAEATTATSGNAVQVLNVVLDRLGVFFDRFADLLENQRR
jgi:hypothetical protein